MGLSNVNTLYTVRHGKKLKKQKTKKKPKLGIHLQGSLPKHVIMLNSLTFLPWTGRISLPSSYIWPSFSPSLWMNGMQQKWCCVTSQARLEKTTQLLLVLFLGLLALNPVTILLRSPDHVERPCENILAKSQLAANINFQVYESGSPRDDSILSHSVSAIRWVILSNNCLAELTQALQLWE